MVSRKLGDFPYLLAAAPALFESLGEPATPQALAALDDCPAIGWTFGPHPSRWLLRGPGDAEVELNVHPRFTSDSLLQIHQAALAGIGIARLPVSLWPKTWNRAACVWWRRGGRRRPSRFTRCIPRAATSRWRGGSFWRCWWRPPSPIRKRCDSVVSKLHIQSAALH